MFKTISQCELQLIAATKFVDGASKVDEDFLPVTAARVSFGRESKTGDNPEADVKLLRYLAKHQHMTPFESLGCTFLVETPLFIRSQIMRHRTFSYSEISRRYTDENLEFWIPDTFRGQAKSNRQASEGEVEPIGGIDYWKHYAGVSLGYYECLVEQGVCREQARAVLPQSLLTKFYMGGNLRNWSHFLKLRLDEHAQYEVRVVAERIEKKLRELWPNSVGVLMGA